MTPGRADAAADAAAIREAIRASNAAWTGGRPRDVAPLFHEQAVLLGADGAALLRGREAMVASYVEYDRAVVMHAFRETDALVHVVGDTAVASYAFEVSYTQRGAERCSERGRELLVLAREDGRWQVVARCQLPPPPAS